MSLNVVFTHAAEHDLRELRNYIVKSFGAEAWQTTYNQIKKTISTLNRFPLRGHVPDEIATLNLTQFRQVLSGINRIIYEIRPETIYVHIVCDSRKDMKSLLSKRLLRTF